MSPTPSPERSDTPDREPSAVPVGADLQAIVYDVCEREHGGCACKLQRTNLAQVGFGAQPRGRQCDERYSIALAVLLGIVKAGGDAAAVEMAAALARSAAGAVPAGQRWRHLKRGSLYEEVGRAELPSSGQFRKRPVVIEAHRYPGPASALTGGDGLDTLVAFDDWIVVNQGDRKCRMVGDKLIIPTLEGDHEAKPGDYIIKGVAGELYPCKPDIFAATYEPADAALARPAAGAVPGEPASYTRALETRARYLAAQKMGLVKDPDGDRLPDDLWRQCLPDARADLPMGDHYEAEDVANDPRVLSVYAAPDWGDFGPDGQAWITALVRVVQDRAAAPPQPAPGAAPDLLAPTADVAGLVDHYGKAEADLEWEAHLPDAVGCPRYAEKEAHRDAARSRLDAVIAAKDRRIAELEAAVSRIAAVTPGDINGDTLVTVCNRLNNVVDIALRSGSATGADARGAGVTEGSTFHFGTIPPDSERSVIGYRHDEPHPGVYAIPEVMIYTDDGEGGPSEWWIENDSAVPVDAPLLWAEVPKPSDETIAAARKAREARARISGGEQGDGA